MTPARARRIALFKVNHLGDNLVFLPVVQALRRLRPDWPLTLITAPQVAALYAADVDPAHLWTAGAEELKRAWRRPWVFAGWAARLRAERLDASLVSYDQSSAAHALARVAGGSVRIGAAGLIIRLRGTMTHEVPATSGRGVAKWNWEMGRALLQTLGGADDWPAEPPPPDLSHLAGSTTRRPRRIVIHAGSKQVLTRWPLDRFVSLAGRLARDHDVGWIDVPETRGQPLPAGVERLSSPDLRTLVQHLAGAALFVGNHSGPMHLATALGTPGVIVCGPSSPVWDPEWHGEKFRLLRTPGLACLPCDRGIFAAPACANLAEPHACMQRWAPEAVEQACREWLARWPADAGPSKK